MKISLGFNSKRYSHSLDRDNNTTFTFGICQPLFSQLLTPQSDIKVSAKQLVRLAPMSVPSFARVGLHTVTRFVPLVDVVPYADALYSNLPFNNGSTSIKPTTLPFTCNALLVYFALTHSNVATYIYQGANDDGTLKYYPEFDDTLPTAVQANDLSTQFYKILTQNNDKISGAKISIPVENFVLANSSDSFRPVPSPANCDYMVLDPYTKTRLWCFNFGSHIKNFRNVCKGLGYSFDFDDYDNVSLAPLLSYFKAWFDTYGLTRTVNFTDTQCFKLIKLIESYKYSFTPNGLLTSVINGIDLAIFYSFLRNLCETYFADNIDFASLHRSSLNNVSNNRVNYLNPVGLPIAISQATNSGDPNLPSGLAISNTSLRALQALSRFVNKNSIIGQNISEWMRVKFGSSVVNTIFNNSNLVDTSYLPFDINDVFSTSDTAQVVDGVKSGEHLGSYAGKGIGFGSLSFDFHAPCHGYVITLASVAASCGYFQGNDPNLFALDYNTSPNSDYDALGMEITHRSVFVDHNSISNRDKLPVSDITDSGFGFVPRYTGFKVSKNIVNGDMSRRGSIDNMCPYYLDKILTSNLVKVRSSGEKLYSLSVYSTPLPSSSYDWRYLSVYPWLGNYNRIFLDQSLQSGDGSVAGDLSNPNYHFNLLCLDDPYLSQAIFKVTLTNYLKPISLSYDTFEESSDDDSKSVSMS